MELVEMEVLHACGHVESWSVWAVTIDGEQSVFKDDFEGLVEAKKDPCTKCLEKELAK